MRSYVTTLLILFTMVYSTFVGAQTKSESPQRKNQIIPQFEFMQIDSLINHAINQILTLDSQSTVIASVKWYIGSYSERTNKFSAHRNHFIIYIFNFSGRNCSIQKIDNFGYFKVEKIYASKVRDFLVSNWTNMQFEKLYPKIDTVYNASGSVTTSQNHTDHQLFQKIKIAHEAAKLNYEYPADYSSNKSNLLTSRFKFLKLIGEIEKRFESKKHNRAGVTFGFYEPSSLKHYRAIYLFRPRLVFARDG